VSAYINSRLNSVVRLMSVGQSPGESYSRSSSLAFSSWGLKYACNLLATVCLGILLTAVLGCGGGQQADSGTPMAATPTPTPPMGPPSPPPPPAPKPEQPADQAQTKELPEDIGQWGPEEFKEARKQTHEKLAEAVEALAERTAGTPEADQTAELLIALVRKLPEEERPKPTKPLRPQTSPYGPPGYPGAPGGESAYAESTGMPPEGGYPGSSPYSGYPGGYPGAPGQQQAATALGVLNPDQIRAIVGALGITKSAKADEGFQQILQGKLETDNDRVAQEASLEAMVSHLTPAREDLIFAVLTSPDKFRPFDKQAGPRRQRPGYPGAPGEYSDYYGPGMESAMDASTYPGAYPGYPGGPGAGQASQKPMSAQELQEKAFELIAPVASPEFRLRLATYVASPKTPQEDFDLFAPYLLEYEPRNILAQVALYFSSGSDPELMKSVEDFLIGYSSQAMAAALGIPHDVIESTSLMLSRRSRTLASRPGQPRAGYPEGYGYMEAPGDSSTMPTGVSPEDYAAARGGGRPDRRPSMPPGGRPSTGRPSRFGSPEISMTPGGPTPGRSSRGQPTPLEQFQSVLRLDPELPLRLAPRLWSPQVTTFIEQQLAQGRSLNDRAAIVLYASTIPLDTTRKSVYRFLQQTWQDGPGALEEAGLLDDVVTDPAFAVVLKTLPRSLPKAGPAAPTGPVRPSLSRLRQRQRMPGQPGQPGSYPGAPGQMRRPGFPEEVASVPPGAMEPGMLPGGGVMPGGPGGDRTRSRVIPGLENAEPRVRASAEWLYVHHDLLYLISDRLYEAARGGTFGGGFSLSPTEPQGAEQTIIEMPPNAQVLAKYELDWSRVAQEKLAGLPADTLRVRYWRLEDPSTVRTLTGFFRRKLPSVEVRELEGVTWLEVFEDVPDSGVKRSIDILIETGESGQGGEFSLGAGPSRAGTTSGVPLRVDILCIEVKNFTS